MALIAEAMTPQELGLPYPNFRARQLETAIKVITSPSKYILIDAPTGSGKTGIAGVIAALTGRQYGKTFITTSTKDLQDQYLRELSNIGLTKVMGRSNFQCKIDHSVSAANGQCTFHIACDFAGTEGQEGCGYYDQVREALGAPCVIFNCAYFLAERQYVNRFARPAILICDEAHDLKNQISSAVTLDARKTTFDHAHLNWPALDDDLLGWVTWAVEAEGLVKETIKKLLEHDLTNEAKVQLRSAQAILSLIDKLQLPAQYVAKPLSQEHIQFLPVWPAPFAKSLLLDAAEKVVFMTATPGDVSVFAATLGIPKDELEVIHLPSTFNKNQRPLNYWPQGKIAGNNPESWSDLIPSISHILDKGPDQKGLVCCVSYKLGAYIAKGLKQKYGSRIMFPDPSDRSESLKRFRSSDEPLVMISPSMSMGVDLPFDQCRFVVIPKIPFIDKSDPVQKARSTTKLGKSLSLADTAVNLVQSYGRAMRDETDWGVTWILDENFSWFRGAARSSFPNWFTEAIRVYGGSVQ